MRSPASIGGRKPGEELRAAFEGVADALEFDGLAVQLFLVVVFEADPGVLA
jgi:hypothetical protein